MGTRWVPSQHWEGSGVWCVRDAVGLGARMPGFLLGCEGRSPHGADLCVPGSIGHNEVIGMCRVGSDAEGPGREHWAEMLANPRKPIEHWHQLVEVWRGQGVGTDTPTASSGGCSMRSREGKLFVGEGYGDWEEYGI